MRISLSSASSNAAGRETIQAKPSARSRACHKAACVMMAISLLYNSSEVYFDSKRISPIATEIRKLSLRKPEYSVVCRALQSNHRTGIPMYKKPWQIVSRVFEAHGNGLYHYHNLNTMATPFRQPFCTPPATFLIELLTPFQNQGPADEPSHKHIEAGWTIHTCEDKPLLVRRDAFLVLNLGLHIVDGVGRLHLKGDSLPRDCKRVSRNLSNLPWWLRT
jgi:hypothetical protein